ncbi:hypothetical protein ABSA28_00969 [Candidatus Hepatincolaceae symbiont of Richtersius coronifer]
MQNGITWINLLFGKDKAALAINAWRETFDLDDEKVQLILKDLACYCNFKKSSFIVNDPYQTAFNEGARDVFYTF